MDDPDAALRELERTQGELRMNGVIVLSNINGRALTDPLYRPFFEECDRRRVCVFIHPMIPASAEPFAEYVLGPIIGFPFDTTLAVARLCYAGVFRELPNIRWILGHLGGAVPYLMERMDNGWRDFAECRVNIDELPSVYLKRLYYDTVSFSAPSLRLTRELVGADHMVMGSDYPHLLGSIDRAVSEHRVARHPGSGEGPHLQRHRARHPQQCLKVARHVRVSPAIARVAGGSAPAITRRWHVDEHKAERLEDERDEERTKGSARIAVVPRPAPSDKPEGTAPHPQDVNEIGEK